jgi:hypothetical protein
VGDFAGPAAIRNIGRYLDERKATVAAFYVSNVEVYLSAAQKQQFYANVATLPVDPSSMLIRFILGSQSTLLPWMTRQSNVSVVSPMLDLTSAVQAGRRPTFEEMVRATKDPNVIAGITRGTDLGTGPLAYVPKGGAPPAGYILIGTTRQTIQLVNGSSTVVDLDVYSRK